MWVPRAAANARDEEPCGRARGSHRVVVEADGAVIRLVTRCTSAEEFIERFARFTTTTDIVVPALPHVSAGTGGHFGNAPMQWGPGGNTTNPLNGLMDEVRIANVARSVAWIQTEHANQSAVAAFFTLGPELSAP